MIIINLIAYSIVVPWQTSVDVMGDFTENPSGKFPIDTHAIEESLTEKKK